MNRRELEIYLHSNIPLSKAMQVSVDETTLEYVILSAPLEPNINQHETVFGGSVSALAILSAWSLLHIKLSESGFNCKLVIQHNKMSYVKPITNRFTAKAFAPTEDRWRSFSYMLLKKRRARININAEVLQNGHVSGSFEGYFVAFEKILN